MSMSYEVIKVENSIYVKALISGFNNLYNNKSLVDELNVFPVPDGDTGTNMSMTSNAAKLVLEKLNNKNFIEIAKETSSAMLRGARGNSGVILSLLFRGIYKGLKNYSSLTTKSFAAALHSGVNEAYGAVMNPTEGTILTVAKDISIAADENKDKDFKEFFTKITEAGTLSVQNTTNILPVLKKAGVVDAGGQGLLLIFEGMKEFIVNNNLIESNNNLAPKKTVNVVARSNETINFSYCTEYIINRENDKSELKLKAYLETIGDCVVVVADDDIIKVHVHTNEPGNAISEALKFGYLSNIKIDNMKLQHKDKLKQIEKSKENFSYAPVNPDVDASFIAVCAGDGVHNLFEELGADAIVDGGQTMNPSTQDLLEAIESVEGKTVFVLPNNKNIIMASEQAAKLADREVLVIQTKTIPQGISALLSYDSSKTIKENELIMTKASENVKTGLITFAARDSIFEGKQIGKNEILGIYDGKIVLNEKEVTKAAYKLMKKMVDSKDQFVTILYGNEVSQESADEFYDILKNKFENQLEINLLSGGQPVYYYIISVE